MKKAYLQKGTVVRSSGWWFVVVHVIYSQNETYLECICDNANNVYTHRPEECDIIISANMAVRADGWGDGSEELREAVRERSLPISVIAEVLSGQHDDRWGDPG